MATLSSPRRVAASRPRASARHVPGLRPPRRVSGPLGGRHRAATAPREAVGLGDRALAVVRGLPDHSLIDRLVRGRAWIPVLGVLLAGIVATQVEILKLGASMGRALEHSSTLQNQNEALQASVASLADDQRIERLAAAMGMSMPTPESLVFLSPRRDGEVARALANLQAPDPAAFASQLAAQAAATAALMPAPPATTTTSASGQATQAPGTAAGTPGAEGPSSSAAAPSGTATSAGATTTSSSVTSSAAAGPVSAPASSTPAATEPSNGTAAPSDGTSAPSSGTGAAGVAPTGPASGGG